jgi:hypothetical protein
MFEMYIPGKILGLKSNIGSQTVSDKTLRRPAPIYRCVVGWVECAGLPVLGIIAWRKIAVKQKGTSIALKLYYIFIHFMVFLGNRYHGS